MRRLGLVTAAAIAALALAPSGAVARNGDDCSYVDTEPNVRAPDDVLVYYAGAGPGGTTDDNMLVFIGVCSNSPPMPVGGTVECGVGDDADTDELLDAVPAVGTDSYCVVDGDNSNPQPLNGYLGVSSYEDNADESARTVNGDCTGNGSNANGGSCLGLSQGISVNQPPVTFALDPFGCQTDDFDTDDGSVCAHDPNQDGDEIEIGHPTPICGNTSGPQWEQSGRDGCSVP